MSLDDAIQRARQNAQGRDDARRREQERQEQEREQIAQLCVEAAAALADYGNERFIQVRPAKWYQLGGYRDAAGGRYAAVCGRACWVIVEMTGVRDSSGRVEGPHRRSPILLLSDGRLGRFWPEPEGLRDSSVYAEDDEVLYVSTVDLDPVGSVLMPSYGGSPVDAVKQRLAAAVVAYERRGIRRD